MTNGQRMAREDRQKFVDQTYIASCLLFASFSRAIRTKTAAIIVKDGLLVSVGFNGMPSKADTNECETHDVELDKLVTNPQVIHGEANAILNLVRNNSASSIHGATMYTLYSPCWSCSSLIKHMGISRIVYMYEYRVTESMEWLRNNGVEVVKLEIDQDNHPHLSQIMDIMTNANEQDLKNWLKRDNQPSLWSEDELNCGCDAQ